MIAKRMLRPLWHRRHRLVQSTKELFGWTFHTLGSVPMPDYVKQGVKDVAMLSVSHLVVHTETFHNWQRERAGTSRLQHITADTEADDAKAPLPTAPTKEEWEALVSNKRIYGLSKEATLDVIIPVYSGYDQSLNTLYTAIATQAENDTPYNIIVIDDASPEGVLSRALASLAETGLFELHINAANLGFVKTVNKGMKLHPEHDVILLNADTEVYNNWVDRLMSAAQSSNNISTVTPLSNNAEICSYPRFCQDNNMAFECGFSGLDKLTAEVNNGQTINIPTGVGFCMFISRASLNDVGYFDEEKFGRGYGEENEFCMRADAKGWKHIMALDTFVRHIGGTSFGANKKKLVLKNYDILCGMHPDYPKRVQEFLKADPVAPYRRALDIARLKLRQGNQTILMVNHQMGGGTERHVKELCSGLQNDGIATVIMEPVMNNSGSFILKSYDTELLPNLTFSMEYDRDAFLDTLVQLNVTHLHIHHIINYPQRILNFIALITDALALRYDVTLHDYYTFCPRINLVDETEFYCGEPEVKACERCIEINHSHSGGMPVWQWRNEFQTFLSHARRVFVPDEDGIERFNAHFALENLEVRPHPELFDNARPIDVTKTNDEPLRIAVIGAISRIKGSGLLAKAVSDANKRGLNVEYILIGHTDNADLNAGKQKFTMTGEYQENEMEALLQDHKPHLVFIPSVWPETYCYTLSIAWRFGIKPVVFDIGAPAQRIRRAGDKQAGHILPYEYATHVEKLNDWFMKIASHIDVPELPANVGYTSYIRNYYNLEDIIGEVDKKAA